MNSNINPEPDITETLGVGRAAGRQKGFRRQIILILLAAAVVITVAIVIWKLMGNSSSVRYITQEVVRGNMTVTVTATGTLQPTNEVVVGSELSGIIKSVEVDYNDRVKVGQVLAKLDTSKIEAQVTQSKAALESAKAKVLQATATVKETHSKLAQLQRVRELSNNRVPAQSDLDAAEAALERARADEASAKAAVSQAQATLDAYETDLSKTVIRSPINGLVLKRDVEPGQTVAATFQAPELFTLAEDLAKMELHVDVDEADIGKVHDGQKAAFSVSAYPGRVFEALITQARYGSTTTSGVVTYETVLKVNNSDLMLRPGMTATAGITVQEISNAILVPSAALRFTPPVQEESKPSTGLVGTLLPRPPSPSTKQRDNMDVSRKQQRVWTLRDGQLSEIPITIGATDGTMTEVVSGDVKPGMSLVVDTVSTEK
jgi:HlyD family secretion protein